MSQDPQMPAVGQILNSMLPMVIIFGLKYLNLDYEDKTTLLAIRSTFGIAVLTFAIMCFMIYNKIQSNRSTLLTKTVRHAKALGMAERSAAMAEGDNETHKMVEETYFEYDMEQLKSMVQTGAISYAITLFLHIKWGYIPPLILQALLSVKKATEQPLFLIYVAGQSEAKKELQRPFKQPDMNPFKSFMPDSMDPEKQAEKKAKQAVKKTKRSDRAPLVN